MMPPVDNEKEARYLQFPLGILAIHDGPLLDQISGVAVAHLAEHKLTQYSSSDDDLDEAAIIHAAARYRDRYRLPPPYDCEFMDACYCASAAYLGLPPIPHGGYLLDAYWHMTKDLYRPLAGKGLQVRLRADIFRDMMDRDWPETWVRILVAIYAGIGANSYKWLSISRIADLANGNQWQGDAHTNVVTPKGVRCHIDKLHERGLFRRVKVNSRQMMYSIRHPDDDALAKEIQRDLNARKRKREVIEIKV